MNEKNLKKIDEIKLRLLQFAESQNIPKGEFYAKIQCHASNFSGKGLNSALSGQTISEICNKFPDLNSDWLLLGRGEMLRKNNGQNVNLNSSPQSNVANGDMKIETSAELVSIIAKQQETISKQILIIEKLLSNN